MMPQSPDDAAVSTDNIQHLTELIGQMKPMYRDPLRLLAMGYTNREIAEIAWSDGRSDSDAAFPWKKTIVEGAKQP